MAQLGIRDKNYRPNQYINPMLISRGREPNPEDKFYRIFDKTNPEHPDYEGNKDDDDDGPEFEQLRIPTVKGKTNNMMIASKRLPFINIDDLEDPVGTLRDGGYPDPDVLDFPSGGRYRKGSDVLDKLIDLELVKGKKNQDMTIAGVPDFPGGGFTTTSGAIVDPDTGEAYYLDGGELIPQGGYDPAKHGDVIPHGGPNLRRVMNNQDMMIANFLTGKTGEGKTLSDEAYDAGYNTIMETTEPNSYNRSERLKILNHQYFDQI